MSRPTVTRAMLVMLSLLLSSTTSLAAGLCPPWTFTPEEFQVRWSRGGGYGPGSEESLTLNGAGLVTVVVDAGLQPPQLGKPASQREHYRFEVPPETVEQMITSIYKMRFFSLPRQCAGITVRLKEDGMFHLTKTAYIDAPSTRVSVKIAGCEHSISFVLSDDAPREIANLADRLQKLSAQRTQAHRVAR